jgi:hypothetical protein
MRWEMKKTVTAEVVDWKSCVRVVPIVFSENVTLTSGDELTVSWEVPDPKHKCGKGGPAKVVSKDGGWEVVGLSGEHRLWVTYCPFCGEKL